MKSMLSPYWAGLLALILCGGVVGIIAARRERAERERHLRSRAR
jgi:hypothetical protein